MMSFDQTIAQLTQAIQNRLASLVNQERPQSLYEPMRYALAQPGKQLRPVLLLLCAEAVGGTREKVLDAAAAIEVVHNFTLVHDDIMDHDELRRGRQTVYRRWDENVAILAGDALLVLGYQLLSRTDPRFLPVLLTIFSKSILEICEGQALDKEFEGREGITLTDYFQMIEKKTGRLFELACEAGAILGNGTPQQILACKQFGAQLGRAFQLQDDLLDVVGDEKTIGKDVGSDLKEGKNTFLMIHARSHGTPQQRERLQELCARHSLEQVTLQEIISTFWEIGTLTAAQQEIDASIADARKQLQRLPASSAKSNLEQLIQKIVTRNK